MDPKIKGSLKAGAVTGLTAGIWHLASTDGPPKFVEPFVLMGGVSAGVHYFAQNLDDVATALTVGAVSALVCRFGLKHTDLAFCLRYGLIGAGTSYIAQQYVAPEISSAAGWLQREYKAMMPGDGAAST